MSRIETGAVVRLVEEHKFDVPVTQEFFPKGLQPGEHTVIAMSSPSEGRVTVMVQGVFFSEKQPEHVWNNPCFRIPESKVEAY